MVMAPISGMKSYGQTAVGRRIICRMAKTTITVITDDLDGSADAQTYSFAWQGIAYTIDLSNQNFKAFDELLQPYLKVATKVSRPERTSTPRSGRDSRVSLADVRAWANENGFQIPEGGPVTADVLSAFGAR